MTAGISKPMIMVSPKPGWIESAVAARRPGPQLWARSRLPDERPLAVDSPGIMGGQTKTGIEDTMPASGGNAACSSVLYGADGIRTHDPLVANQVLSQLSYRPPRAPRPPQRK